jgi:hypothetical protein
MTAPCHGSAIIIIIIIITIIIIIIIVTTTTITIIIIIIITAMTAPCRGSACTGHVHGGAAWTHVQGCGTDMCMAKRRGMLRRQVARKKNNKRNNI